MPFVPPPPLPPGIEATPMAEPTQADLQQDRSSAVFEALAPLAALDAYRRAAPGRSGHVFSVVLKVPTLSISRHS